MKAIVFPGPAEVEVRDVPQPMILEPNDAILRVTTAAICGSDLHFLHGDEFNTDNCIGHEFVGVVEEVGAGVQHIKPGERYVSSMYSVCGRCGACARGEQNMCVDIGLFGLFAGLLPGSHALPGGQAEYVRIPNADVTLWRVPDDISDEDAYPLSDILATAFTVLSAGRLTVGESVAIVGAGPVGQLAVMGAPIFGAAKVFAIDFVQSRLDMAESFGAIPIDGNGDPVAQIREATEGRGVDVAIEAVGIESALATAHQLPRPGGRLASVNADGEFPFTPSDIFLRRQSVTPILGNPFRWREPLTKLIQAGRLTPSKIISHRMKLSDGIAAYAEFDSRRANKIVLTP